MGYWITRHAVDRARERCADCAGLDDRHIKRWITDQLFGAVELSGQFRGQALANNGSVFITQNGTVVTVYTEKMFFDKIAARREFSSQKLRRLPPGLQAAFDLIAAERA